MLKPDPNCTLCKLGKSAKHVCRLGVGPIPCDIAIVGEAPNRDGGAQLAHPLILESALKEHGITEYFYTNAVSCPTEIGKKPTKAQISKCKAWLDHQFRQVQPKYVLLLGNSALQSITGAPGINSKSGRPFEKDGIIYLPVIHPTSIFHDETNEIPFLNAVALFADITRQGEVPREDKLRHKLIRTSAEFEAMLDSLKGTVSFDIETNSLYPWQRHITKRIGGKDVKVPEPAKITMIGFGTADGEFSIPMDHPESPFSSEYREEMVERISERLEDCMVVAHNGKFDFLWMKVHYGVDWYESFEFDTMLAHYMLDENSRHGLKLLAQKYCGAPDWDVDKDTKTGNSSLDKLALYHGHDLYYTRQLRFVLGKQLAKDKEVSRVFKKIMMPCARLFVEVEYDGIYLDTTKFHEAEEFLLNELCKCENELKQWQPPGDFNWGSPTQLANLLYNQLKIPVVEKTPTGNPSCSESALKQLDHPCVGALLRYRAAKQQLSFFIEGWKPFIHERRDGSYLHPSFKLHGTVTGRLSCEHPNLQQVPRDPRIRTLITAPPGWTLLECDLSQIELRVAAELANERNMILAFRNNIDVHWLTALREIERGGGLHELVIRTAKEITGRKLTYSEAIEALLAAGPDAAKDVDSSWSEYRKKAKAINFGYLYGMWWKKFKIYARDNYGVEVTDEQAEASRVAFFDLYGGFNEWHSNQRKYARRNGYVMSLSGRKRRLPKAMLREDTPERREAERQAINSPVQSFANDLNLMAALQLRSEFGRNIVRLCGTVHDAVLLRVRDEEIERVTKRLLTIMQHPRLMDTLEITVSVPIEAEAKVGPWGAGINLEKWLAARLIDVSR